VLGNSSLSKVLNSSTRSGAVEKANVTVIAMDHSSSAAGNSPRAFISCGSRLS